MKNSFGLLIAAIVFAVSIQSAALVHAENLVTNGNFATGDFSGWNHGSGPVVQSTGIGQSYGVFLDQGRQDEFSQSLSTVVGQEYLITFWIAKDLSNCTDLTPGSSCSLMAEFGAATVFDELLSSSLFGDYTNGYEYLKVEAKEIATSADTLLRFSYMSTTSNIFVDEISVVPVPEIDPSSFGSAFALVIGALGLVERRRKTVPATA